MKRLQEQRCDVRSLLLTSSWILRLLDTCSNQRENTHDHQGFNYKHYKKRIRKNGRIATTNDTQRFFVALFECSVNSVKPHLPQAVPVTMFRHEHTFPASRAVALIPRDTITLYRVKLINCYLPFQRFFLVSRAISYPRFVHAPSTG